MSSRGQHRKPSNKSGKHHDKHLWLGYNVITEVRPWAAADGREYQSLSPSPRALYHTDTQLRCQYPQKSTLGLLPIASATTRSTCDPLEMATSSLHVTDG